ncbi:MAG: hypothetical protein WAN46_11935 [Gammaproteobacteria bacterium]
MSRTPDGSWYTRKYGYRHRESIVEHVALAWLESVGWQIKHGAEMAPGASAVFP